MRRFVALLHGLPPSARTWAPERAAASKSPPKPEPRKVNPLQAMQLLKGA